jgi:hypothetical protein
MSSDKIAMPLLYNITRDYSSSSPDYDLEANVIAVRKF